MPYDAFISYRHADAEAARAVAKLLRAFDQSVFIDDGIALGVEWAPEIWTALGASKKLIVLWSRSAAKSEFVHSEWSRAPAECIVFALQLDGEALPDALGKFNAITGLDVAGRLLARSVELMKGQKLSPSKAQEQLLRELEQDGIVLEEKQKRALAAFLPIIGGTNFWFSASLPTLTLIGGGLVAAFGLGYWLAPGKVVIVPGAPLSTNFYPATPATGPDKPCDCGRAAAAEASAAPAPAPATPRETALRNCPATPAPCEPVEDKGKVTGDTAKEPLAKVAAAPVNAKQQLQAIAPANAAVLRAIATHAVATGGAGPIR